MKKVKLIVHESYQGKRKPEEVFASVLMSNAALTENSEFSIIKSTDRPQDPLCSVKGATNGTSEE